MGSYWLYPLIVGAGVLARLTISTDVPRSLTVDHVGMLHVPPPQTDPMHAGSATLGGIALISQF